MSSNLEGDGIHEPSGGYYGSSAHERWLAAQEGREIVYVFEDFEKPPITAGEVVGAVVEVTDITDDQGRVAIVIERHAPTPTPLAWLERVLPADDFDEQVGDAMERLERLRGEGSHAWVLRFVIASTIFWCLATALRDRLQRLGVVRQRR